MTSGMPLSAITVDTMRTAFARYAETHEAASIQWCWSTWTVLCTYLYSSELIAANPMSLVGRPMRPYQGRVSQGRIRRLVAVSSRCGDEGRTPGGE
jgi:integrase/recombinase XerC